MDFDRGTLARIDRRVFAELAHTGGVQAVKGRRSLMRCGLRGGGTARRLPLSMGEGVAGLIAHELETVVGDGGDANCWCLR